MERDNTSERERPVQLKPAALLMCVFNVAGVLFYLPIEGISTAVSLVLFGIFYLVVATVSFGVVWFFWCGHNWARWLVLATSVLALLNLLLLPSYGPLAQLVIVAEAGFAVWMLYWLNTTQVLSLFVRRVVSVG